MRAVAFTVDVDRDVNQACQGRSCSISQGSDAPRFDSSARGLREVLRALEGAGAPGTFFWEGRTALELASRMDLEKAMSGHEVAAHGHEHEDFSGEGTGIPLDRQAVRGVLESMEGALDSAFGSSPRGFRAPYQRTSPQLMEELSSRGYLYDSSATVQMVDGRVAPYRSELGLLEAPVCWSRDRQGRKIVSYLWPYHEGRRPMSDYLDLLNGFEEGLLVMATHSWHMVENYCTGPLPRERVEEGVRELTSFLNAVRDSGAEVTTIGGFLRRRHGL